jgi:PIN domain nuclease of toxin-antitoxin system
VSDGPRSFLLDTHAFPWMTADPDRLGPATRERVEDPSSELLLSIASVWEMAIKTSLGRLTLPGPVDRFVREQLTATRTTLLGIDAAHAAVVAELPWHHRDPFDRLLVAQALSGGLVILSRDAAFDAYDVERVW